MKWQEYQEAVGELYVQMEGIGQVQKNITIPDRVTGQPRQVDVWLGISVKGHSIGILIDAKYRKDVIDVKDVEEVASLAQAVGANKCVLVALNGWTKPAAVKAQSLGLDLRILTLDEALDLVVSDKWVICPSCENDCVIMEFSGGTVVDEMWSLITAGKCRECKSVLIHCWSCGEHILLESKDKVKCGCGHWWKYSDGKITAKVRGDNQWNEISSDAPFFDPFSANSHIERGLELKNSEEIKGSIEEFTKAIELAPMISAAYYHRGLTYDEHGYIKEAINDYTKVVELDPEYAMGYGSRGIAYYALEMFSEAIASPTGL